VTAQSTITIRTMPPGWTLLRPIVLRVACDDPAEVVVWDEAVGMFGSGCSRRAAVRDYKVSLTDLFHFVAQDMQGGRTGSETAWQWLTEHIARDAPAAVLA
jgi:hypothetical protein